MKKKRLAIILSLTIALTGIGVSVVHASNFSGATGQTGCGQLNMADNGEHTYYYSSLTSAMSAAVNWTRTNNLNPTDMSSLTLSTPTSTTDVVAYDLDYTTFCGSAWHGSGGNVIGQVQCVSTNSASRCEKHEMRFDTSYTAGATTTNRRSLACHENGHTIGLAHRADATSCMESIINGVTAYSSHDIAHINANY